MRYAVFTTVLGMGVIDKLKLKQTRDYRLSCICLCDIEKDADQIAAALNATEPEEE